MLIKFLFFFFFLLMMLIKFLICAAEISLSNGNMFYCLFLCYQPVQKNIYIEQEFSEDELDAENQIKLFNTQFVFNH